MLFIVAILWGSSYVFAKLTVEAGMHSGLINACRGTMCVLAGGLIFFKKIRHMTWVDFRLGLVIGTINFLGYYLQTDATTAGLILMLESFFASVMSVIMGYDPLTPQLVIGGVILLVANAIMEVDLRSLVVLKRKMF